MDGSLMWTRASNNKDIRTKIIFTTLEGFIIEQSFTLDFPVTNNEAEYEVIITSLKMAVTLEVTRLEVCYDSLLVVSQVKREYTAKDERMTTYLQLILRLKLKFLHCDFKHISRSENNLVDSLASLGSAIEY